MWTSGTAEVLSQSVSPTYSWYDVVLSPLTSCLACSRLSRRVGGGGAAAGELNKDGELSEASRAEEGFDWH